MLEVGQRWLAEADTEDKTPTREVVECDGFPRQLVGATAGDRRDHGSELDVVGRGCDCSERHPRVDNRNREVVEQPDVIPQKEAVPTGLLSVPGEFDEQSRVTVIAEVGDRQGGAHWYSFDGLPGQS